MINSMTLSLQKYLKILVFLLVFFFITIPAFGKHLALQYATHFNIEYLEMGCKMVTDGMDRRFLLVPWDKKISMDDRNTVRVIRIPIKKVATRWSTIPGFLNALNVLDSLLGVTTRKEEWCAKAVKKMMDQGIVENLGNPGAIDYEKFSVIAPDVFFSSPWVQTAKMMELKIPVVSITEYREEHPLGRMEWIKFFAAFYNREKEADSFFKKAVQNIRQLSKKLEKLEKQPKVVWGFIRESGMVFAPGKKSYVNKMISLTRGVSPLNNSYLTLNMPVTLELFYHYGRDAEIYIYPASLVQEGIKTIDQLIAITPILNDFESVKKGNVWCLQPWYWESVTSTDQIMEDIAAILHPLVFPHHSFKYFIKLKKK